MARSRGIEPECCTSAAPVTTLIYPEAPAAALQLEREKFITTALPKLGSVLSPEYLAALTPHPIEKAITGANQAGKSWLLRDEVLCDIYVSQRKMALGYMEPRPLLYWIIVPSYKSAHKEMDYLLQLYGDSNRMGGLLYKHFPDNDACKIITNGGVQGAPPITIETKTAMDIPAVAGEPVDGFIVAESGQVAESIRQAGMMRTAVRRSFIVYGGTLEDPDEFPKWLWYEQMAQKWMDNPEPGDHEAYSLPMWANLAVHPEGIDSPVIQRMKRELPPYIYDRKVAGLPGTTPNAVYDELREGDWSLAGYLADHGMRFHDLEWLPGKAAGGHDFGDGGENHPSTLAVITVATNLPPLLVVRECWWSKTISQAEIDFNRMSLSGRYHVNKSRWGFDPMQREAAKMADASMMPAGSSRRLTRAGYVKSYLNKDSIQGLLLFDMDPHDDSPRERDRAAGVRRAFTDMQRVHLVERFVSGQGLKWDYGRTDDDLPAAIEDAVLVIGGPQGFSFGTGKVGGMKTKGLAKATPARGFARRR